MKQELSNEEDESLRNHAVTFAHSFLETADITNHELVADVDSGSQDNYHVLTYQLKPSGDGKRVIEFTYVGWPTSNPLLKDRQYTIIQYAQIWTNEEDSLENFVRNCGLLQSHGDQIKEIVGSLPDDISKDIKKRASPYEDRSYRVIQRSKIKRDKTCSYVMFVELLCDDKNWKERARVVGSIEKIVANYYQD